MIIKYSLLLLVTLTTLVACDSRRKVEVIVTPPAGFSTEDKVNMVGAFNDWAIEGPSAVELTYQNGKLVTDVLTAGEDMFFTFVKNSDWQSVPASIYGKGLCNYHHKLGSDNKVVNVDIPAWKSDKAQRQAPSTSTGDIEWIKGFESTQFNRNMDLQVYLPKSYRLNQDKSYPVLYMLDGQNLFDAATAYSDEWRIDEWLSELEQSAGLEVIVVAIPNSPDRWQEYNPWDFVNWSGEAKTGKGEQTIAFIKDAVKPFIDEKYRTDKQQTGLAGSSLGGLMALYAAMEHSDVFSFVAAFSPSLSIENQAGKNVLFEALRGKKLANTRIYFDMGKSEYGSYEKVDQLNSYLEQAFGNNLQNIKMVKDDIGRHCELDWSKRFPVAISWLMAAD